MASRDGHTNGHAAGGRLPAPRQLRDLHGERHLDWYDYAEQCLAEPLGSYLDYGCGPGLFLSRVVERCDRAYGVDVDAEAVAAARRTVPAAIVQRIDPHAPLGFADEEFDTISILEVIEHVADEAAVLRELTRVLRPGGLLLLTTPHRGLMTFLDPGNLKVIVPGVHRLIHRGALRNAAYYEQRFGDGRAQTLGMLADITLDRTPWHRHYRFADIRRLTPAALETVDWRVYFPLMRAFCCVGLALRVLSRGRMEGMSAAPGVYRQFNRLSRVQSAAGDQLAIIFRKRAA